MKLLTTLGLSLCLSLTGVEVIQDQSDLKILTPTLARQKRAKIRLDNGLEAYLISDPYTHTSGAALAVGVGSWEDPEEAPGMAHFVEHMLFLGTAAYPDEEDFQRYLTPYEGKHNAFTASDRTVYGFSIANEGFVGGLTRFAHFFIDPLLTNEATQRERIAIDQEFAKDQALDVFREHFVRKELGEKSHPFHGFCIGNKTTLGQVTHDELQQWISTHYSASLMHLVVYSPLSLEELQSEVVRLFTPIERRNLSFQTPSSPLLAKEREQELVAIVPLKEVQKLELIWEMPSSLSSNRQVQPDELLGYVLGHEGEGSLLSELKRRHLALDLSAGSSHAGRGQRLFALSIDLTALGVSHYEEVIQLCFGALASFKKEGYPSYLFEELVARKTMGYVYQRRKEVFDQILDLAAEMVDEPLATFPRQTLMPLCYEKEPIAALLDSLKPEHCHYTLIAKEELLPLEPSLKEKWMEVSYGLARTEAGRLQQWAASAPLKTVHLPKPNRFLPKKIEPLLSTNTPHSVIPKPQRLHEEPIGHLDYIRDDRFLVPELSVSFLLRTPSIQESDAASKAYADLYCQLVKERLSEVAYEAKLGELNYTLEPAANGLKLCVSGFSERAGDFFQVLLDPLLTLRPTSEEFTKKLDALRKSYVTSANQSPLAQSLHGLQKAIYLHKATPAAKLEATQDLKEAEFTAFCQGLWKRAYVEGLAYGNLEPTEALALFNGLKKRLHAEVYPKDLHTHLALKPLSQEGPFYSMRSTSLTGNAVLLATDCGGFSFKRYAALEVLSKALEEPFFSELRTRQQTGYLVKSSFMEAERGLFALFAVQSSTHDSRDLLARFELFLEGSLSSLRSSILTPERFETMRRSCVAHLTHLAEGIPTMGELLAKLSFEYGGDFAWVEKRIAGFEELTYAECLEYAQEFFGRENPKRFAVCVNGLLAHPFHYQLLH